jgi:hypothetical protein
MARKRIELTLTLEVETGDADIIDVTINGSSVPSSVSDHPTEGGPSTAERMIEDFAPPPIASFQKDFAERCVSELGLDLQPPSGERKYINAFPPKRYGSKRAAALNVTTGRVEIYCRPENAKTRKFAEVVTNRNEPFAVKVYLRSTAAVDQAIALTRLGLDERGT